MFVKSKPTLKWRMNEWKKKTPGYLWSNKSSRFFSCDVYKLIFIFSQSKGGFIVLFCCLVRTFPDVIVVGVVFFFLLCHCFSVRVALSFNLTWSSMVFPWLAHLETSQYYDVVYYSSSTLAIPLFLDIFLPQWQHGLFSQSLPWIVQQCCWLLGSLECRTHLKTQ